MKFTYAMLAYLACWLVGRIIYRMLGDNPNAPDNAAYNAGAALLVAIWIMLP